MYRHLPLFVLSAVLALLDAGALAFRTRLLPDLLTRELPPLARDRLAVAGWLVPTAAAFGTLVVVAGILSRRGRARLRLAAAGVVLAALPIVAATLAFFAAVFAG